MDSMNILVVDDSPIITRKLTMMIELLGYKVIKTAANGRDAVAAYSACRPDVVTMDITMPEMDGIEATHLIIGEFPDAKIIMVTSHGQEKMVINALKAGAKGYVLKPFDGRNIYEAIQKACQRVMLKDKLQSEECNMKDILECNRLDLISNAVIPAKAGIQCMLVYQGTKAVWIPAFAGMTMVGSKRLQLNQCRDERMIHVRKSAKAEPQLIRIYQMLGIDAVPSSTGCVSK